MKGIIKGRLRNLQERRRKNVELGWWTVNEQVKELDYVKKREETNIF